MEEKIKELEKRIELLETIITINSGFIMKNLTGIMDITGVKIPEDEQQVLFYLKENLDKININSAQIDKDIDNITNANHN